MKLLLLLLRTRILAFFAGMSKNPKTGKPRGTGFYILMGVLFLYVGVVFLGLFAALFGGLGAVVLSTENAWLYFAAALLIATALAFVGSVFATVSQLYEAKDNQFLLSMPIPPRTVLASRMIFLLLYNLLFTSVVLLPALAIYLTVGTAMCALSAWGILALLLSVPLAPTLSLVLSLIVGYLVALLLRRAKNPALVQTALSLLFLGVYFVLYFSYVNNAETIFENFDQLIAPIIPVFTRAFYPFYLFGLGATGQFLWGLLGLAIFALPAFLVFFVISRTFLRFAVGGGSTRRTVYHRRTMRTAPAVLSLMKKDISHLLHSSAYFVNAGLGLIFLLAAAVAVLFVDVSPLRELLDRDAVCALLGAAILFLLSMTFITAPSLSVEAKTLWMLRSFPLSGRQVLGGKVLSQVILCAPICLLASVSVIIVSRPSFLAAVGVLLLPQICNLLLALYGMILGALFPRFVWQSEAEAVKQGLAVFLAMFGGWFIVGILCGIGLLLALFLGGAVALLGVSLLSLGVTVLLAYILFNPMAKRFESLVLP